MQWLGAVQAQDYLGALWAIGLRMSHATEAKVEQALADRSIVRTWPMRGTIHFVPAADVRWMLQLLTPRMLASSAARMRQAGLDEKVFSRSRNIFINALQGGNQLSRTAMYKLLEAAGISTNEQRGLYILHRLSAEGLLCFAARQGKQPAFALLDEWVPDAISLPYAEALAKLALRYFTSHGPATVQDFAWWTGLTVADAKNGVEMIKSDLRYEVIEDRTYWFKTLAPAGKDLSHIAYLLPNYDEYIVGYTDRSAVLDEEHTQRLDSRGNVLFSHTIVIDGQVIGAWKRVPLKKDAVVIETKYVAPLAKTQNRAVNIAAERYGAFLGLPIKMSNP